MMIIFFFSLASVSKSLLIVLGTLPWRFPQTGDFSQLRPCLSSSLCSLGLCLRHAALRVTCGRPWLLNHRLREENRQVIPGLTSPTHKGLRPMHLPCAPFALRCSSPALRGRNGCARLFSRDRIFLSFSAA